MGPYGSQNYQNATPSVFIRSEPNFMIEIGSRVGKYKVMDILVICQKIQNFGIPISPPRPPHPLTHESQTSTDEIHS